MKYFRNIIAASFFVFIKFVFRFNKPNPIRKEKVLFVNLGLLGDVVMSTIIFSNEKLMRVDLQIVFLTNEKYKVLFEQYLGKIEIEFVNTDKYRKNLIYRIKYLVKLNRLQPIKVFNLSFGRLAIDDEISLIAGINGETFAFNLNPNLTRIGVAVFENSYTSIVQRINGSDIQNFAELIKSFLIDDRKVSLKINLFPKNYNVINKFNLKNDYFIIAPFASIEIKNWSINNYLKVSEIISEKLNLNCVFVSDSHYNMKNMDKKIINLMGKTNLNDVVGLIKNSKFFIGNDSGLIHIAKALEKKTFAVVGGGAFGRIYPYSENDNSKYFFSQRDCFNCDWKCKYEKPYCLEDIDTNLLIENILSSENT